MSEEDAVAKAREQAVNRNLQAVLVQMRNLQERFTTLEGLVTNQNAQIAQLQQKYNLLLTQNFHGGSTEP